MSDTVKTTPADCENNNCLMCEPHGDCNPQYRRCVNPEHKHAPAHPIKDCPQYDITLDVIEDATKFPWSFRLSVAARRFNAAVVEQLSFMLGMLVLFASVLNGYMVYGLMWSITGSNSWIFASWFAFIIIAGFTLRGYQRGLQFGLPAQLCSVDGQRNLMSCIFCGIIAHQAYLSLALISLLYLGKSLIVVR